MSRRVLSLFMAFVFCFSILPTAAFAEGDAVTEPAGEGITAVDEVRAEDEGSTEETAAQPTEENDVSLFASEDVAEVTIDGATTSYSDIMEAFAAAQATKTPAVIKLINDVSIGNRNVVLANDGDITFDLNGCVFSGTYSSADGRYNGLISLGASGVNAAITFTLTDTAGGGKIQNTTENSDTCVIYVSSTKARLKVEGGTIERSGDDGTFNGAAVIYTAFGNVEVYGGTLTGNIYGITVSASGSAFVSVSGDAKVYGRYAAINSLSDGIIELSGGTYSSGGSKPTFRTVSGTIGSLLKEGYTFISESGAKIDPATSAASFYEEVYVVEKVNPVAYIDENGNAAQCAEYTTLSGDPEDGKLVGGTNGEENWYVLTGQFRAEKNWTVSGNVNLILTDGSSCYATEFSIKLEDKAVLKVYGQENSTGTLTAICGDEQTAALGGPAEKSYDPEYGITGDWTRGSLELYGGNINVTSSKYYAAFLRYLTVKGGTFTAKAPEDIAAISLQYGDSSLTLADDFKIVEANDPQRRISYANIAGIAVLMAKCTEHVWSYSASEDVGMHKATCDLCSTSREETHTYNLYGGTRDETKHNLKCVCGAVSEGTEAHDFACLPNSDTLTHGKACKVCGYRDLADDERHDFTADKTTCADCGFQRGVHLALGAEEFNYATLGEAIVKAAGDYAKPSSGGVITVCGGIEVFDARPTSINWGTFTIDFGGSNLKLGIGKSAFVIGTYADVTLKNGGLDLSGHMSYTTPGILVDAGKLTLENFTVTASCHSTPGKEHKQYPGITVKSYDVNPRGRLTIKDNVTLRGGFTVDGRYSEITRLTGGTFVCSCDLAVGNAPMIDLDGKKITDILADGYALAKADDANTLVPMYDENGDALSQIATDVQVVPHNHDLSHGKCGCGYLCTHENTDADGKCTACGAQIMAAKITWTDGETEQSALAENTDAAVQKVNALNESGKSDVTVTLLMDLDSEWVMKDSGTFMLTAADGVTLSKNITADGETDVTVAGGTYGGADAENPFAITAKNGGKIALKGGRFYGLQTGGDLPGIGGVMANGYALAKADDANTLVPMYDENGVFLSQIKADIQVVPHTHNAESGKCVCGYVCEHKNVDNSGKCTVCGAQVMTVKITWTDGGTEQSDFTKTTDAAVQKASELSGAGKSDVTVTLLADLDSEWVIKDGGTFKLTTADGVRLSKNITVDGKTDVTVIGGTYGSKSESWFTITYRNGGKVALMGGGFYELDVIEKGSVYAPGIASIMADGYAFYRKDAAGNEYLTDLGHASSFSLKGESDPAFIRPHTDHVFEWRQGRYGEEFYACGCGLEAVAFITTGENTVYYADLQEAINAAKGGDTIVLCGFTRLQEDIVIENNWDYNTPVTIDLNGRTVSFTDGSNTPNGHKMIVNDYAAVTIKGEGRITSLFAEPYAIICLYGGTYGRLEKRDGDGDGVLGYCAKGYGLKGSDGWITQYYSMAVSDVMVKKAPYEIKNIIATTDPAGTADAAAFYTEQKAYVKAAVELESGEEAISDPNPVLCSVSVTPADGGSPAIEQIKCYSSDVSVEVILPDKSGDYVISVTVWHLGCEVKGDTKRITVSVCSHDSYTDGKCDTCGVACKHTDVSDAGHCGICKMDFNLSLTTADGSVSYYADVPAAFKDAGLAANKGCTLKLFRTFADAITINPGYEKQAERAEFTFDLNGFDFGDWNGTLVLNNADMTLISSKSTGGYIGFYSMLRLDNNVTFKSPATESKLFIGSIHFPGQKTSTVSLGTGVYLSNLSRPSSPSVLESGEMLEEGCVFRLNGGNGDIVPRNDSTTGIYSALVIRCPHEMENDMCKYCGFVCAHTNATEEGDCPDCNTRFDIVLTLGENRSFYRDLYAAFDAVQKPENNGCTVKLIRDITFAGDNVKVLGGDFIFDINGKIVNSAAAELIELCGGKMTLKSETQGTIVPQISIMNDAQLVVSDGFRADSVIMTAAIVENSTSEYPLIVDSDHVRINNLDLYKDARLYLSKGVYGAIMATGTNTSGAKLLADGYVFANKDTGDLIQNDREFKNSAEMGFYDLVVVPCPHTSYENGKCVYCGLICEHKNYQDGKCADCGTPCLHKNVDETTYVCGTCNMQMAVKTEKKDGAISYGTDLFAAMNAAEDGETITLLKDTALSENVYVYGSGKTVTLDLNGFIVAINGEHALHVGVTPENAPEGYGTLAIVGKGNLLPALNIWRSGTLDLSGWAGGEIGGLSIEENSAVKGDIPGEAHIGTMTLSGFTKSEINEIVLNGGSYGKIQWNNADGEIGLTLGSLLAPGYAFAQEDQYVLYTKTLNAADASIANVRAIKCANHADADGDGKCDYCNVQLVASLESSGVKRVYTDLQEAFDAVNSNLYTVWLFTDANGSYTVKKGSGTFKMNGKTINEIVFEDDAKVALNDSGTVNSVTFRGKSARFSAGAKWVTINKLMIADGATWSSILPDADNYNIYGNRYGYKVYSDSTTYRWYDRNTIGDEASISNVKVIGLPVSKDPVVTLDDKTLPDQSTILVSKTLAFGFETSVTDGYGGEGVLFIQKEGDSVPTRQVKPSENDGYTYTCPPVTLEIGTYEVWAEVTKEGYTRGGKRYTLNVVEKFVPTGSPTLDKTEITYGDEIGSIGFSSDRLRDENNKVDVLGTFAWRDGSEKPLRAGDYEAEWIFTPNDDYAVSYASVTGKATIKVNKAAIPSGAITAPGVINNLVYKIDDDTPQVLHTTGDVENSYGTMKYTLGDPESADADWSERPIASRNAGEFTVYYKVFGDENHLDSAYGEISCSIAKYKLKYSVVCSPKVYDGNDSGDPTKMDDVKFFNTDDPPKEITLRNDDYEIVSIRYKSKDVGGNLGADDVEAEADITFKGDIAVNYALAGGTAYGRITPASFEGINFNSYTYKVCYTNTVPRSVTPPYFGALDNLNYKIYPSTNLDDAKKDILSRMEIVNNSFFTFAVKEGLMGSDIGKKGTVKFKIYSKDHNYCTDELSFTVEIVDKASPRLTPDPVTMVYNGKAVPKELITGTATIDGYRIEGSWSWEDDNKAPVNVTENEEYTVVFTPRYEYLYYSATAKAKVTVTPREIGDESISFAPVGSSYAYTGEPITPKAFGEYKYDKNEIARKLAEDTDYTVTYPADVTNVGEKEITVTGHGNFGGTRVLKYTITPCETTPTVTLSDTEYTYDGNEKRPAVTVTVNGKTLVEGTDFDVAYANNTDAEAGAKVTVTAKGNYGFAKMERFFHIQKADAAIDTAPAARELTYNGMSRYLVTDGIAKGGTFRYKLGDGDWTSSVPMARDAGKYTVWYCVIGDNNHKDLAAQSVEVNLEPKDIENAEIILFGNLTYNGETQTQELFGVRVDGLNVYTYDVANNTAKDAGDYVLTVKASGNFKGEKTKMFTVARKTVTANVTVNGTYTYNKTPIEPTEVVVKDGETVISGDEYSLSFANNTEAGTATVTVSDKDGGNYAVSGTGTFTIDKATVPVRPNDITKVYGEEAVPTLWSDSPLIQESDLAEIAKTPGIFSSDGIAKTAPVVDGGYVLTVDPSQCETKNLIFRADGAATITVNKAPLTIKVKDVRREYGAENPPLEVEYSGFVSGEDERVLDGTLTLSYDNRIHAETAVGTYEKAAHAEGLSSGNYAINYLEGDVVIEKIAVTMTTGTARSTYLTVELDRPLAGLTAADFTVTDSEGQIVPISRVTASADQLKYSLTGNFAVGSMHTVTLNLDQTPYHLTHNIVNPTLSITPQRGGGGGSVSGLGGGGGTSAIGRYTVTFETNGGSRIEKQSVAKNTLLSEPSAPTKEGYAFAGWYTDKELKEKYDFSQTVTKNLTLYAAWTEAEEDLSARQMILTIGEKEAMVFGERKTNDVAPQIVGDRTMLPARFVAENLGAIVAWNGETEVVTIRGKNLKDNTEVIIVIPIGSEIANVNGREYRLDSPAFVENDRTYTPIRFISEELGANVDWIESEQKVVITK